MILAYIRRNEKLRTLIIGSQYHTWESNHGYSFPKGAADYSVASYEPIAWVDFNNPLHHVVIGGRDSEGKLVNTIQETWDAQTFNIVENGGYERFAPVTKAYLYRDPNPDWNTYVIFGGMVMNGSTLQRINEIWYADTLDTWAMSVSTVPCNNQGTSDGCNPIGNFAGGSLYGTVFIVGGSDGNLVGSSVYRGVWDSFQTEITWTVACIWCSWSEGYDGLLDPQFVIANTAAQNTYMVIAGGLYYNPFTKQYIQNDNLWLSTDSNGAIWNKITPVYTDFSPIFKGMMTYANDINVLIIHDPDNRGVFTLGTNTNCFDFFAYNNTTNWGEIDNGYIAYQGNQVVGDHTEYYFSYYFTKGRASSPSLKYSKELYYYAPEGKIC